MKRRIQKVSFHKEVAHRNLILFIDSPVKQLLTSWIPTVPAAADTMDVDASEAPTVPAPTAPPSEPVPEVEIYLRLLILHHLLKAPGNYGKAMELAHQTVEKMMALNRRSMDPIAAKVWFAVERTYELGGELCDARP